MEGQPFLTVFDQVYGSLRLSSRLLEPDILSGVFVEACLLAATQKVVEINQASRAALSELCSLALQCPVSGLDFGSVEVSLPDGMERVILPGSKGLLLRSSEEFRVLGVVQMPNGLSYEGVPSSLEGSSASTMPLLIDVAEIPGESEVGAYDPATGKIDPLPEAAIGLVPAPAKRSHRLDQAGIAGSLASHLEENQLISMAQELGLTIDGHTSRLGLAEKIVAGCLKDRRLEAMVKWIERLQVD